MKVKGFLFCLFLVSFFGFKVSPAQTTDTSTVKIRGNVIYYVDGFKTYAKLSKADSVKVLSDMVEKLNGCWHLDSNTVVQTFRLSEQSFSGTWEAKGIISTAPLVRLEIINNQIKLINTDLIGGDGEPSNISIYGDELRIDSGNEDGIYIYRRQKCGK